jgi:hypothetical protein
VVRLEVWMLSQRGRASLIGYCQCKLTVDGAFERFASLTDVRALNEKAERRAKHAPRSVRSQSVDALSDLSSGKRTDGVDCCALLSAFACHCCRCSCHLLLSIVTTRVLLLLAASWPLSAESLQNARTGLIL